MVLGGDVGGVVVGGAVTVWVTVAVGAGVEVPLGEAGGEVVDDDGFGFALW